MLIIVKHGDVEKLLEPLLDEEALRCLDVFQVDPAEGGAQCLDDSHDVVGVPGIDLDVEHVDICEPFEQQRFALHHRLGGRRSDIPKPQHGGPVAHHRHQVSLGRVRERLRGVRVDPANGFRDAGRVGQGKVTLRGAGLGYLDCNLPRTILLVVLKRVFAQALHNHPPRVESRTATPSRYCLTLKVSPPFLTRHRVRKVFRHVCVPVAPCFIRCEIARDLGHSPQAQGACANRQGEFEVSCLPGARLAEMPVAVRYPCRGTCYKSDYRLGWNSDPRRVRVAGDRSCNAIGCLGREA